MPDQIIEQGSCWTIYDDADLGPAVPYPAVQHSDGQNYGFVNLREHPELIEQIVEAQGCTGLQKLLKAINADCSPLMSLGCEKGLFDVDNPQSDGPTCYLGSYVDIAYADPAIGQSRANLLLLAKKLVDALKLDPGYWLTMEVGIQKMRHFFGQTGCYNLLVRLSGHGRTAEEARKVWDAACTRLATAIPTIEGLP